MDTLEFIDIMERDYKRAGVYHTMEHPDNDYTSGNHHCINATYYSIVMSLPEVQAPGHPHYYSLHRQEAEEFIESTRAPNGSFKRTPISTTLEAQDDYIGILATSSVLHLQYGDEIYKYGSKWRFPKLNVLGLKIPIPLKYYFDNLNRDDLNLSCWHGRFLWTIALYKTAGGVGANLFDQLAYSVYLLADTFNNDRTDTSGRILQWLGNKVMKGKYWMVDLAIKRWENHIIKLYTQPDSNPGQMGSVLGIYHQQSHPFSKIMANRM